LGCARGQDQSVGLTEVRGTEKKLTQTHIVSGNPSRTASIADLLKFEHSSLCMLVDSVGFVQQKPRRVLSHRVQASKQEIKHSVPWKETFFFFKKKPPDAPRGLLEKRDAVVACEHEQQLADGLEVGDNLLGALGDFVPNRIQCRLDCLVESLEDGVGGRERAHVGLRIGLAQVEKALVHDPNNGLLDSQHVVRHWLAPVFWLLSREQKVCRTKKRTFPQCRAHAWPAIRGR